jgi:hypothetical protein
MYMIEFFGGLVIHNPDTNIKSSRIVTPRYISDVDEWFHVPSRTYRTDEFLTKVCHVLGGIPAEIVNKTKLVIAEVKEGDKISPLYYDSFLSLDFGGVPYAFRSNFHSVGDPAIEIVDECSPGIIAMRMSLSALVDALETQIAAVGGLEFMNNTQLVVARSTMKWEVPFKPLHAVSVPFATMSCNYYVRPD